MTNIPKWEEALWLELNSMTATEAFLTAGEWTSYITDQLLTKLAVARRLKVLAAMNEDGMDSAKFADLVGSRPSTIDRLRQEGAKIRRDAQAAAR